MSGPMGGPYVSVRYSPDDAAAQPAIDPMTTTQAPEGVDALRDVLSWLSAMRSDGSVGLVEKTSLDLPDGPSHLDEVRLRELQPGDGERLLANLDIIAENADALIEALSVPVNGRGSGSSAGADTYPATRPAVVVPETLVRFLLGEGDLDGVWFGDEVLSPRGRRLPFWWRTPLRACLAPISDDTQASTDSAALARAERAEQRIRELAEMFGIPDGGRYLNDWIARRPAAQPVRPGHDRHMVEVPFSNGMRLTIVREDEYDAVTVWSEDEQSIFTSADVPHLSAVSPPGTEKPSGFAVDHDLADALKDPALVHINMLRGGIAKPTPTAIGHLYRGAEAAEVVSEVRRQNPNAFPDHDLEALREMIESRIGQDFDGECHLTEDEARAILSTLLSKPGGVDV